ncbi:RNA-directed DNA polymerase from mobile element jockey [Trichonephila clavipes]|nr:RNA-directed DNA polymerase from mobile element jockey [Trichonephila clavipes]
MQMEKGFEFMPSRSEVVFLKLFGIGNSAFLLAAAFAYLLAMILAPNSIENRVSFSELISFTCLRLHSLCTYVIFGSASNPFDLDQIMATANVMDSTQNGIINNVHITSSPSIFMITDEFIYDNQQSVRELINLRDSYAIWARKLSIVPATSDEYTATSAELGNIPTALLATKERMNLRLFRLPISIEALDALIKKVEEQRAHLTPVGSTPKETSDTTLNSPSKRTLKNLRLKTDKKRLIDDDGFQTPDKRHTAKKIAPLPPAESSDSEIEDEGAGKSNITAAGTPKNRIPPIFVNPPDNWCTLISIARQLSPTLISKLTGKFLRITVQSDDECRKLAQFLRHEGVEYKSFMLKSDRPLKLLIRGLPTSTKVEEIRVEIEREGFQIHIKSPDYKNLKQKSPCR